MIGASTVGRLIACPASFALSQQASAQGGGGGSSVYAAHGTAAHALAEEALTQGYDPVTQLDEVVMVDGYEITVDADMIEAVRVYVDEVSRRAAGAAWFALETRVCLDDYWPEGKRPRVSAFGTADMIAYHLGLLHLDLVDYKNGAGVFVDVVNSPQLNYYAAGALLEIQSRGWPTPITVDLTIVQPNVRGKEKVRTFRTTALDVMMWVDDVLKPTIAEAMAPGARIAGGSHCRFCPAKAGCPALAAVAQDLARRDFGPSPDELVVLTAQELGQVLRDADIVGAYTSALQDVAEANIQNGVPVPGWSLVPSRPMRSWAESGVFLTTLLSPEWQDMVWTQQKLRTPADLEKLLPPDEWALIQPYVQSKSSGVRLVPNAADPSGKNPGRATARDDFA